MAEYSSNAVQTVDPGESIVFTDSVIPCYRGFIRHRDETGNFVLSGNQNRCFCNANGNAVYLIDFGANVAIPENGTAGEVSVAIAIDGATIPASSMIVTPAAVSEYFNISRAINAQIWSGCCETITVRNTSSQPILVQNANIIFSKIR